MVSYRQGTSVFRLIILSRYSLSWLRLIYPWCRYLIICGTTAVWYLSSVDWWWLCHFNCDFYAFVAAELKLSWFRLIVACCGSLDDNTCRRAWIIRRLKSFMLVSFGAFIDLNLNFFLEEDDLTCSQYRRNCRQLLPWQFKEIGQCWTLFWIRDLSVALAIFVT